MDIRLGLAFGLLLILLVVFGATWSRMINETRRKLKKFQLQGAAFNLEAWPTNHEGATVIKISRFSALIDSDQIGPNGRLHEVSYSNIKKIEPKEKSK